MRARPECVIFERLTRREAVPHTCFLFIKNKTPYGTLMRIYFILSPLGELIFFGVLLYVLVYKILFFWFILTQGGWHAHIFLNLCRVCPGHHFCLCQGARIHSPRALPSIFVTNLSVRTSVCATSPLFLRTLFSL